MKKKELVKLYSNCLAGLFLGYQEDFGMVPLEIISYGKPLIAVDEGGYVNVIGDFHKIKEKHNLEEISGNLHIGQHKSSILNLFFIKHHLLTRRNLGHLFLN